MPRMDEATKRDFLEQPHIGVLASIRANGLPYTVPVWWLYDEGAFWLTGTDHRVWCKQLQRDARCSLCIEALTPVAGFVAIEGLATLHHRLEEDIWPMSRRLAEKYVGQGIAANAAAVDRFFDNMRTEPRLLFSLQVTHWRAIDMRVYRGKKADREFQSRSASHDQGGVDDV